MDYDLIRLYNDLTGKESGTEVKNKIEAELQRKMREHFLGLMGIGQIMGYDKLQDEMKKASEILEQLKNK